MSGFKCVPGDQLALTASALAVSIAQQTEDSGELALLAAFFTLVGDSLALIAAQRQACPPPNEKS